MNLQHLLLFKSSSSVIAEKPRVISNMKLYTFPKRSRLSPVLVALELGLFLLVAALALGSVKLPYSTLPMASLTLAGASVCLAAWTLMHNRPGNFNISPVPKLWSVFVSTGPYQWIRHPMYTSLLMGTGALALTSIPFFGWVAWSVLALILLLISILEERWMREQNPGYCHYARESHRFLPWIF